MEDNNYEDLFWKLERKDQFFVMQLVREREYCNRIGQNQIHDALYKKYSFNKGDKEYDVDGWQNAALFHIFIDGPHQELLGRKIVVEFNKEIEDSKGIFKAVKNEYSNSHTITQYYNDRFAQMNDYYKSIIRYKNGRKFDRDNYYSEGKRELTGRKGVKIIYKDGYTVEREF